MRTLGTNIIVSVSKNDIDGIFSKEVVDNQGNKKSITINVDADEMDDRAATLFVETGIVKSVGALANKGRIVGSEIESGDVAIISYSVFNDYTKFLYEKDGDKFFLVDSVTRYHDNELVVDGNRTYPKNQLVWRRGEVEALSELIGFIKNGCVVANDPYVFLEYEDEQEPEKFKERPEVETRRILSVSEITNRKYCVMDGDDVCVRFMDTFDISIKDKKVTVVDDEDLLMIETP